MKIAPLCRAFLNSERKQIFDKCINQCETSKDLLYLNLLKSGKYKSSKSEATWPNSVEDDDDVIIIGMYKCQQLFKCKLNKLILFLTWLKMCVNIFV